MSIDINCMREACWYCISWSSSLFRTISSYRRSACLVIRLPFSVHSLLVIVLCALLFSVVKCMQKMLVSILLSDFVRYVPSPIGSRSWTADSDKNKASWCRVTKVSKSVSALVSIRWKDQHNNEKRSLNYWAWVLDAHTEGPITCV